MGAGAIGRSGACRSETVRLTIVKATNTTLAFTTPPDDR